ncbi:MAG: hypothetical protein Satyrvirus34_7 [Satyrvirus sp.]|uniref:Uncharacterized protein n=1 Tax=Satyrvirus sp. TaxID=2487771 RepID=A0A3G5AEX5_9VIRU|nr:MAG: hypothetical protein Satyrvirus34_7 [Satyrvirus sp.]
MLSIGTFRNILIILLFINFANIVVSLSYQQIKNKYNCSSISNDLCCGDGCTFCGICNETNPSANMMCCSIVIIDSNKICDSTTKSPCIIDLTKEKNNNKNSSNNSTNSSTQKSGGEIVIDWFGNLSVIGIILISVALACAVIVILYACCIFGDKKPPTDYALIVGKE